MVKQRIIEEASELFARSGVKGITMDDLARHLGISKRTIYENFKDKEELLTACINAFHEEYQAFSQKVFSEADNVAEAIVTMLRKDAEQASQRQVNVMDEIRKYYPQVHKEHLTGFHAKCDKFGLMIKRGMKEGVFRENLNPDIIVHFFLLKVEDFSHHNNYLNRFSFTELFENLAITFLRGICTSKGLKIIDQYKEKVNYHTHENTI